MMVEVEVRACDHGDDDVVDWVCVAPKNIPERFLEPVGMWTAVFSEWRKYSIVK